MADSNLPNCLNCDFNAYPTNTLFSKNSKNFSDIYSFLFISKYIRLFFLKKFLFNNTESTKQLASYLDSSSYPIKRDIKSLKYVINSNFSDNKNFSKPLLLSNAGFSRYSWAMVVAKLIKKNLFFKTKFIQNSFLEKSYEKFIHNLSGLEKSYSKLQYLNQKYCIFFKKIIWTMSKPVDAYNLRFFFLKKNVEDFSLNANIIKSYYSKDRYTCPQSITSNSELGVDVKDIIFNPSLFDHYKNYIEIKSNSDFFFKKFFIKFFSLYYKIYLEKKLLEYAGIGLNINKNKVLSNYSLNLSRTNFLKETSQLRFSFNSRKAGSLRYGLLKHLYTKYYLPKTSLEGISSPNSFNLYSLDPSISDFSVLSDNGFSFSKNLKQTNGIKKIVPIFKSIVDNPSFSKKDIFTSPNSQKYKKKNIKKAINSKILRKLAVISEYVGRTSIFSLNLKKLNCLKSRTYQNFNSFKGLNVFLKPLDVKFLKIKKQKQDKYESLLYMLTSGCLNSSFVRIEAGFKLTSDTFYLKSVAKEKAYRLLHKMRRRVIKSEWKQKRMPLSFIKVLENPKIFSLRVKENIYTNRYGYFVKRNPKISRYNNNFYKRPLLSEKVVKLCSIKSSIFPIKFRKKLILLKKKKYFIQKSDLINSKSISSSKLFNKFSNNFYRNKNISIVKSNKKLLKKVLECYDSSNRTLDCENNFFYCKSINTTKTNNKPRCLNDTSDLDTLEDGTTYVNFNKNKYWFSPEYFLYTNFFDKSLSCVYNNEKLLNLATKSIKSEYEAFYSINCVTKGIISNSDCNIGTGDLHCSNEDFDQKVINNYKYYSTLVDYLAHNQSSSSELSNPSVFYNAMNPYNSIFKCFSENLKYSIFYRNFSDDDLPTPYVPNSLKNLLLENDKKIEKDKKYNLKGKKCFDKNLSHTDSTKKFEKINKINASNQKNTDLDVCDLELFHSETKEKAEHIDMVITPSEDEFINSLIFSESDNDMRNYFFDKYNKISDANPSLNTDSELDFSSEELKSTIVYNPIDLYCEIGKMNIPSNSDSEIGEYSDNICEDGITAIFKNKFNWNDYVNKLEITGVREKAISIEVVWSPKLLFEPNEISCSPSNNNLILHQYSTIPNWNSIQNYLLTVIKSGKAATKEGYINSLILGEEKLFGATASSNLKNFLNQTNSYYLNPIRFLRSIDLSRNSYIRFFLKFRSKKKRKTKIYFTKKSIWKLKEHRRLKGRHSKKQINLMAENFVNRYKPSYRLLSLNSLNVSKLNYKLNRLFYLFSTPNIKNFNNEITNISRRLNMCLDNNFSDTKTFLFVKEIVSNLINNKTQELDKQNFGKPNSDFFINKELNINNKVKKGDLLVNFIISFLSSVSNLKFDTFKKFNGTNDLLTFFKSEYDKNNKDSVIKLISKSEFETIFSKSNKTVKPLLSIFGKINSKNSKRKFLKKFIKQSNTTKLLLSTRSVGKNKNSFSTDNKNRFYFHIKKNFNKFKRKFFLKKKPKFYRKETNRLTLNDFLIDKKLKHCNFLKPTLKNKNTEPYSLLNTPNKVFMAFQTQEKDYLWNNSYNKCFDVSSNSFFNYFSSKSSTYFKNSLTTSQYSFFNRSLVKFYFYQIPFNVINHNRSEQIIFNKTFYKSFNYLPSFKITCENLLNDYLNLYVFENKELNLQYARSNIVNFRFIVKNYEKLQNQYNNNFNSRKDSLAVLNNPFNKIISHPNLSLYRNLENNLNFIEKEINMNDLKNLFSNIVCIKNNIHFSKSSHFFKKRNILSSFVRNKVKTKISKNFSFFCFKNFFKKNKTISVKVRVGKKKRQFVWKRRPFFKKRKLKYSLNRRRSRVRRFKGYKNFLFLKSKIFKNVNKSLSGVGYKNKKMIISIIRKYPTLKKSILLAYAASKGCLGFLSAVKNGCSIAKNYLNTSNLIFNDRYNKSLDWKIKYSLLLNKKDKKLNYLNSSRVVRLSFFESALKNILVVNNNLKTKKICLIGRRPFISTKGIGFFLKKTIGNKKRVLKRLNKKYSIKKTNNKLHSMSFLITKSKKIFKSASYIRLQKIRRAIKKSKILKGWDERVKTGAIAKIIFFKKFRKVLWKSLHKKKQTYRRSYSKLQNVWKHPIWMRTPNHKFMYRRFAQFAKRRYPNFWYRIFKKKFPLKSQKKSWAIKIPKSDRHQTYSVKMTTYDSSINYIMNLSHKIGYRFKFRRRDLRRFYRYGREIDCSVPKVNPPFKLFGKSRGMKKLKEYYNNKYLVEDKPYMAYLKNSISLADILSPTIFKNKISKIVTKRAVVINKVLKSYMGDNAEYWNRNMTCYSSFLKLWYKKSFSFINLNGEVTVGECLTKNKTLNFGNSKFDDNSYRALCSSNTYLYGLKHSNFISNLSQKFSSFFMNIVSDGHNRYFTNYLERFLKKNYFSKLAKNQLITNSSKYLFSIAYMNKSSIQNNKFGIPLHSILKSNSNLWKTKEADCANIIVTRDRIQSKFFNTKNNKLKSLKPFTNFDYFLSEYFNRKEIKKGANSIIHTSIW